ncbi:MAG: hypothetical protein MK089_04815 [Phycisphaerales bacterium]|nr:hypothetical protein [Phycisphaerales bacterium]
MGDADNTIRCLVWGVHSQLPLFQAATEVDDFVINLVGGPLPEDTRELSEALDVTPLDDLRTGLLSNEWDVAWLAAPGCLDADLRQLIRGLDRPVATSTPPADSVQNLMSETEEGQRATFIPLMRLGRPFRGAEQVLENFGVKHSGHIEMIAGGDGVTSASLLYDAMDLAFGLFGMPDNLFAARAGEGAVTRDSQIPLNGHLVVSLRYPNRCAAAVSIAEGGGQWSRRIVVLGEGGRLIVSDDGVEWLSSDGDVLDAGRGQTTNLPAAGEVAAHHLKRLAIDREPTDEIDQSLETSCLCEAVRLSCITGQAEDPAHVLRMLRKP